MLNVKGHRSVGGIRVSLYNAIPLAAAQAMAELAFSGCDGSISGAVTTALVQAEQGSVALAGDRLVRLADGLDPSQGPGGPSDVEEAEPAPSPPA